MGPSGHFYSCMGLRTYETQVFRRLTGCQQIPGIWGITSMLLECTNEELVEIDEEISDTEMTYSIISIT